jgi:hypothetical protein
MGIACVVGVCGGDASADGSPDGNADANPDAADASDAPSDWGLSDRPDGDADETGDGGSGDASDGADSSCTPPYDQPDKCGDCATQCGGAAPICALVDGNYACVPACTPPLVDCSGVCVDLDTDPENCGSCGNKCPSGICQAGKCVGATAGHVVLMCTSFEQSFQSSPQTALLGNAVFLPTVNPVRILAYGEHSTQLIRNRVNQAIGWAATAKGRTFNITQAPNSAAVASSLDKTSYDVLLVYDQTTAPAGTLGGIGTSWASTLSTFVVAGGVVVIPSGGGGTGEMGALVTNAGLLTVSAQPVITGSVVYNTAPADAVGLNVLSPFVALNRSCTFTTSAAPGPSTVFVVTNGGPDAGSPSPVVIHRIP